jgi:ABC-2 type transport system ATP-binding protein/ribosome-dependent ATPase
MTAGVTKRFGAFTAVNSVDLAIEQGEVVGLLGANGAGKTTLIRMLLGLVRPSAGTVQLRGSAPSLSTRRGVGYGPQSLGLYDDLTVEENWSFTSAAFGRPHRGDGSMPQQIVPWRSDLVGSLGLGTQRLVAFAIALSHGPELLVLDEPTSGVGPLGRARLWEDIREAADRHVGVLVTTHNLEEAEQCDRLIVMADGEVAASGTVAEIVGERTVVEVRTGNWHVAFAALDGAGLSVSLHGDVLRVGGSLPAVSDLLSANGLEAALEVVPANLEETFVAMVSAEARR